MKTFAITGLLLLAGCSQSERTASPEPSPTTKADIAPAAPAGNNMADLVVNRTLAEQEKHPPLPSATDDGFPPQRQAISGLEQALKYREKLSDGRATPADIRDFLRSADRCQGQQIPRYAQMMSCTYHLKDELSALKRKYRRDKPVLAVLEPLSMR